MVWYFIGVHTLSKTFHGPSEIRKLSSCVENLFHSFSALSVVVLECKGCLRWSNLNSLKEQPHNLQVETIKRFIFICRKSFIPVLNGLCNDRF